jgi:hypothetical protein
MFLGILRDRAERRLRVETLVAVVDTLRTLALLNADVDVPALDVVLLELPDTIELVLDAIGPPLRIELGDVSRWSASQCSLLGCGLRDELYVSRSRRTAGVNPPAGTGRRARRPRGQSSTDALGGGAEAKPMIKLVMLLAVADINVGGTGVSSSTGETRPRAEAMLLPKLSFHFDGFLVIEGAVVKSEGGGRGTGVKLGASGLAGCWWTLGSGGTGGGMRPTMATGTAFIATGLNG